MNRLTSILTDAEQLQHPRPRKGVYRRAIKKAVRRLVARLDRD